MKRIVYMFLAVLTLLGLPLVFSSCSSSGGNGDSEVTPTPAEQSPTPPPQPVTSATVVYVVDHLYGCADICCLVANENHVCDIATSNWQLVFVAEDGQRLEIETETFKDCWLVPPAGEGYAKVKIFLNGLKVAENEGSGPCLSGYLRVQPNGQVWFDQSWP